MELVQFCTKQLTFTGLFGIMTHVTRISLSDMHNSNTPALEPQHFVSLPDKSNLVYQGHFSLFMHQQMSVVWDMGWFPMKNIGSRHSAAIFTLLEYYDNTAK